MTLEQTSTLSECVGFNIPLNT